MDINVSLSSGKKIFPGEVIHKIWKKKKKNDENLHKEILHFTSTCNYILYKIQIFIKIKFYKIEWICKICNETFVTIFTTYEFYLLCEKDFGVSYFDKKKLSCILWTRKPIWRWMEKREKRKKSKKIKRRARTAFSFFSKSIKKKKKKTW